MNKPQLNLISHRFNLGDTDNISNNHIDNSMISLTKTIENTLDMKNLSGLECDIRLTKDNVLAVNHEKNIRNISTTKENKLISQLTYKELCGHNITDLQWYYRTLWWRSFLFLNGSLMREVINQKLRAITTILKAEDMLDYLVSSNFKKEILLDLKLDDNHSDKYKDNCCKCVVDLITAYEHKLNIAIQGYDVKRLLDIKEKTNLKTGIWLLLGLLNL